MSNEFIYNGEVTKRRSMILIAVCALLVRERLFLKICTDRLEIRMLEDERFVV